MHLIINNQIGFTAGPRDLRSTVYCSDAAKAIEAPIVHANGDFPESVLRACRLAVDYQREFGADSVVDMVCYRRHGHNEGDEPAANLSPPSTAGSRRTRRCARPTATS